MKSAVLLLCSLIASAVWAAEYTVALAKFDEDVAQSRRIVRQYCAMVQEMTKSPDLDGARQTQAMNLLDEARQCWQVVIQSYSGNPPSEYALDKQFSARLTDFANALDDMQRALANGQVRRSLLACGFGCGLFVKMHEENGLVYALDELYRLRQTAKTAFELAKTKNAGAAKASLPAIMERRNQLLCAPLPWPTEDSRCEAYRDAVREVSGTIDELARALSDGNDDHSVTLLEQLIAQVNVAYGLAL